MKIPIKNRTSPHKRGVVSQIAQIVIILVLFVAAGIGVFLLFYNHYNDRVLYNERLSQMQDVTAQLYSGLEDVVQNQWNTTDILCNYVEMAQPRNADELQQFMEKQARLNKLDGEWNTLLAVDDLGRYYTAEGMKGTLQELNYLLDDPERVSYVSNTLTTNRTKMVFLKRMDDQPPMQDGSTLVYYGFARDMSELEPYFDCAAYEGDSGVYVIDNYGLKLFSSSQSDNEDGALIKGYNVYSVLEKMQYLHESSFEEARQKLEDEGLAYSNAVLNGEEYFYSLYRMKNSEWTLLFLVNSQAVAMNTVELVNTTTVVLLVFAVFMVVITTGIIYWILRRQQRKELQIVEENAAALSIANEKLEDANAELALYNKSLEEAKQTTAEALETAKSANKAKSEFLANMSHDIRTPMNAIVGIARLMQNEPDLSDKMYTYIEKVLMSSRHLLSLINDVLDMSRIESSEVSLNQEPVSLAEQVGQVESIIRPQVDERGQTFVIRVHDVAHEYLIGDGVRLRQVFINLLSNAVKYTPYNGSIQMELAELPCTLADHATFRITVSDNGCGMTPEFMERIFEPFSRAESSTTNKVQGTGLGMAITKNIVDLMGGTITVQSRLNEGSTFEVTLTFPIDRQRAKKVDIGRILLISDDGVLVNNMAAALNEADIPFSTAATEADAKTILAERKVEVILLAGRLHDKTLPETVRLLRGAARDAVLIFCCDYEQQENVYDILTKSGVDGLIPRPFFLSNLIRAIEHIRGKVSPEVEEQSAALNGVHFLCAEDNEINAEILSATLEMHGASCTIYPNGKELVDAFEKVKPGEYDMILMDIMMPVMDGLEATRAIRKSKNPLGKTIPIVAMTANAFDDDVRKSQEAGMDAHLSKPMDVDKLKQTVQRFRVTPRK